MKCLPIIICAVLANYAAASEVTRCGTSEPPENLKFSLNSASLKHALFRNGSTRTVDTYAHVVTTQQKDGTYTEQQVNDQIKVMNKAYGLSGFQFNILDTDFTTNDEWAAAGQGSQAELDMKSSLKQDTYENLNLYFLSDLGGGLLGFGYFPLANTTQNDLTLDGCVNLAGTLPGANEQPDYALGMTSVHETGHWLGLFHVFQGSSCSGRGDYISDTPAQKLPTQGCPASSDTCPDQPGQDSIHNYMDYS